eukprot:578768-Prymnesium_polylepis.1
MRHPTRTLTPVSSADRALSSTGRPNRHTNKRPSYPASQGTCRAEHTRALLRSPRVRKARSERGSAHAHSRTPVVKQVQAPQGAAVAYVSCPRAARGHHRRAPDPSSSPHRRSRSPPHTPTCAPAAPRVLTSVVCSRARAARSRQTL